MSLKISTRSQCALFVLAFAAGCSSPEPTEQRRTVTGSLSTETLSGLVVPSVVAQDTTGATFDGPVTADGGFSLSLPVGRTYRLFVTDLRASGRRSAESRVLWPGRFRWATLAGVTGVAGGSVGTGGAAGNGGAGGTSDGTANGGVAGTGGAAGSSGSAAGTGGAAGSSGSAAGTGGAAGSSGNSAGTGGAAGSSGNSAGTGGAAGSSGNSAGTGGAAGSSGRAGGIVGAAGATSDGAVNVGVIRPAGGLGVGGAAGSSSAGSTSSNPGSAGAGGASSSGSAGASSGSSGSNPGSAGAGGASSSGSSGSSGAAGASSGSSGSNAGTAGAGGTSSSGSSGASSGSSGTNAGSAGANGSSGSSGGSSGGASSGASSGASGSVGSGSGGSAPKLCAPPQSSVSVCTGAGEGLSGSDDIDESLPPCAPPSNAGSGSGSGAGSAPSTDVTGKPCETPAGAPTCEQGKQAVYNHGRWDCVKMETPVTYFYSDKPMKVHAAVEFPRGVLTQWYPAVAEQYPLVADAKHLITPSSSKSKVCSTASDGIDAANGLLDWGILDLLGRDANVDAKLPFASLDRFTWSFARQVSANPLRAPNGQLEKFLFYRGIGNFALPVRVTSEKGGKLALANVLKDAVGPVFFLNVNSDHGAFTQARGGIAPGATLPGRIPSLEGASDVETYADALSRSVRTALDGMGLYDDEATAMVNTWKRQWFRTPGARLLYLAPQSWTDESIPLTIDPKPESTKRVMVIRVEVITPELEAADVAALKKLETPSIAPEARAHFGALGRFAEPRLRRAITLAGSPAWAQPLLAEVVLTNHTTHTPTAGTTALVLDQKGPRYSGKGFVVHEWGTDTIVVGSDGSQLLGLQHEEEDLPRFVYDKNRR